MKENDKSLRILKKRVVSNSSEVILKEKMKSMDNDDDFVPVESGIQRILKIAHASIYAHTQIVYSIIFISLINVHTYITSYFQTYVTVTQQVISGFFSNPLGIA